MVSLTTVSMAESSDGGPGSPTPGQLANTQQAACIFCRAPLPYSSAPFCTQCGNPQKKCINRQCQAPVPPSAPMCYYCGTPQQQSAKKCINPQCGAPLHPIAMYCATCSAPQDPAMFQQFLSAAHCISCSAKLFIPGQKSCHVCGSPKSTRTSMGHGGQQPLPHVSQPSVHPHVSQPSHSHTPQPVTLHPQTYQPPSHIPQATPLPQTYQPPSHIPQATPLPQMYQPPSHVPQATPLPQTYQPPSHVPQATPLPQTYQPPPPPHIPQATPHLSSVPLTDSTVQQQVSSHTKRSPDGGISNSACKRSRTEVKLPI